MMIITRKNEKHNTNKVYRKFYRNLRIIDILLIVMLSSQVLFLVTFLLHYFM